MNGPRLNVVRIHCVLFAFALLIGGCIPFIRAQSASGLTLREWVDSQMFAPVILWPEPEGSKLWFPPRHIDGPGYVELFYSEAFIGAGVEPSMYMLYESKSDLPVGQQLLTDYDVADTEVTINDMNVILCGKPVLIELRESSSIPDSGVAIFELDGTHVAYHWRHMSRATALSTLEHHITQVYEGDFDTILSFDRMLVDRFQTPRFSPTPVP
jgi:hypothetical protein